MNIDNLSFLTLKSGECAVFDRARNYLKVAHINQSRQVKHIQPLTDQQKTTINNYARRKPKLKNPYQ